MQSQKRLPKPSDDGLGVTLDQMMAKLRKARREKIEKHAAEFVRAERARMEKAKAKPAKLR
jgi:hypothetical protein